MPTQPGKKPSGKSSSGKEGAGKKGPGQSEPGKSGLVIARRSISPQRSELYRKIRALEKAGTALHKTLADAKRRMERAPMETIAAVAIRYRGETIVESGPVIGAGAAKMEKFIDALLRAAPQMDAATLLANADAALALGKSRDAALYRDADLRWRLKIVVTARGTLTALMVIESMKKSVGCSMSSRSTDDLKKLRRHIGHATALLHKAASRRAETDEA